MKTREMIFGKSERKMQNEIKKMVCAKRFGFLSFGRQSVVPGENVFRTK